METIISTNYCPLYHSITSHFWLHIRITAIVSAWQCDKIYDQMYLLLGSRPPYLPPLLCLVLPLLLSSTKSAIYKLYGLSQKLISVCFNNLYQCADLIPARCTVWLPLWKRDFLGILEHTKSKLIHSPPNTLVECWAKSAIVSFRDIKVFLNRLLACRWISQEGEARQSSKH